MAELENFDLAHISAVEILTPTFDQSLRFFNEMLAMREVERIGNSAYLRCWDEYETYSIKLTASETNGVGRTMLRATSPKRSNAGSRPSKPPAWAKAGVTQKSASAPTTNSKTRTATNSASTMTPRCMLPTTKTGRP